MNVERVRAEGDDSRDRGGDPACWAHLFDEVDEPEEPEEPDDTVPSVEPPGASI